MKILSSLLSTATFSKSWLKKQLMKQKEERTIHNYRWYFMSPFSQHCGQCTYYMYCHYTQIQAQNTSFKNSKFAKYITNVLFKIVTTHTRFKWYLMTRNSLQRPLIWISSNPFICLIVWSFQNHMNILYQNKGFMQCYKYSMHASLIWTRKRYLHVHVYDNIVCWEPASR